MFTRHFTSFISTATPDDRSSGLSSTGYRPIMPDPLLAGAGLPPLVSYDSYLDSSTLIGESDNEKGVKWLNRLLRGEISAIETYEIVVKDDSLKNDEVRVLLSQNLREHRDARSFLEKLIFKWRGEPDTGSGVWGVFTEALTAGAKTLSHGLAIDTLARGEEHGRQEYISMLEEMSPQSEISTLAREMLRAQERHTRRLDLARQSFDEKKSSRDSSSADSSFH